MCNSGYPSYRQPQVLPLSELAYRCRECLRLRRLGSPEVLMSVASCFSDYQLIHRPIVTRGTWSSPFLRPFRSAGAYAARPGHRAKGHVR